MGTSCEARSEVLRRRLVVYLGCGDVPVPQQILALPDADAGIQEEKRSLLVESEACKHTVASSSRPAPEFPSWLQGAFPYNSGPHDLSSLHPSLGLPASCLRVEPRPEQGTTRNAGGPFSVDVADHLYVVERHTIERIVRKSRGRSFHELQQEYLLRKALRLLSGDKAQSIKQIAYDLDYQWPEDFSRFIKRATGHTPSEIRSQSVILRPSSGSRQNEKAKYSTNARRIHLPITRP